MADNLRHDASEKGTSSDIEHLETLREQRKHGDHALEILGDERVHVSEEDVGLFFQSSDPLAKPPLLCTIEQADRPRDR
jgi:hypothetical protein